MVKNSKNYLKKNLNAIEIRIVHKNKSQSKAGALHRRKQVRNRLVQRAHL